MIMVQKNAKPDFQKWDKWQQNLKRIDDELQNLDRARRLYFKFCEIVKRNKNLKNHSEHPFIDWLSFNYCVRLGMGIRRLVDKRSNKLNIYRLLLDVKDYTRQINVDNCTEYFVRQKNNTIGQRPSIYYSRHCRELTMRAFKEAFGRKRKTLLVRDVDQDLKFVEKGKAKIEKFVDENWAHMGKKNVSAPTTKDAHKCLDILIKIYNKYSLLLFQHKFLPLDENILFLRWETIFRIHWIE